MAAVGASLQDANMALGLTKAGKAAAQSGTPMNNKQKAAVKHALKLKFTGGEITQAEFDAKVQWLDAMYTSGMSLQQANASLGLSKKAQKTATATGASSKPAGMKYDEYVELSKALFKKENAGLITDVEYRELHKKLETTSAHGANTSGMKVLYGTMVFSGDANRRKYATGTIWLGCKPVGVGDRI